MNFSNCYFLRSFGLASQLIPSDREEIVFCGRSNVGKSTLINKICNNNKLARVSSTPGKTAPINFYALQDNYYLVDLPGYGFSKKSLDEKRRWAELMEGYFSSGRNIKLGLLLLDSRRVPNGDDISMMQYFSSFHVPFACVVTKTDKLNSTEYISQISAIEKVVFAYNCVQVIPYSSLRLNTIEFLREKIGLLLG